MHFLFPRPEVSGLFELIFWLNALNKSVVKTCVEYFHVLFYDIRYIDFNWKLF